MAYDVSKLGVKLKSRGVNVAEDALAGVVEDVFDWAAAEAAASESQVDDLVVAALFPIVKPALLAKVDQLDGQDDPGR